MATSSLLTMLKALRLAPSNIVIRQPTFVPAASYHYFYTYDKSTQKTHLPAYRRTRVEIAKALRRKQNYLHFDLVDKHRHSRLQTGTDNIPDHTNNDGLTAPRNYRFIMPEFMPNPDYERRDRVFEKLERQDMLRRRAVIHIPEFYVGSIMAATVADSFAPNKKNRFVGICIDRGGTGLRAYLVLRNVVEGLGVEVVYSMYDPRLLSVEVLKLEKRLDDELYYLRDALPEYSTFPFDMDPLQLPKGAEVPVNSIKVVMKHSKEWEKRWEQYHFHGIESIDVNDKRWRRVANADEPWKKKDIMHDYRSKVPEEEEEAIMSEVFSANQSLESTRKSTRMKVTRRKKSS